uniref:Uncharacterized protein n=1 Tax=Kalanchoe fedtschenkoi TaxID=63787 RepID=A0A7N0UP27_KALFE
MAEVEAAIPSLAEQYVLPKDSKPIEAPKVDSPVAPEEAVGEAAPPPAEDPVEAPAVVEEVTEEPKAAEEAPEVTEVAAEETNTTAEEINTTAEEENSGEQEEVAEETPEIKLETAPADFRFPTTNQTRHCFTRYIEYHRCVAAKGEGAPECDKFAKYYRSLCPGEWIDRWNEQRENGTFPGPL